MGKRSKHKNKKTREQAYSITTEKLYEQVDDLRINEVAEFASKHIERGGPYQEAFQKLHQKARECFHENPVLATETEISITSDDGETISCTPFELLLALDTRNIIEEIKHSLTTTLIETVTAQN